MKNIGIWRKGEFSIDGLLKTVLSVDHKVGAVACFFGVVRGYTHSKRKVKMLELEAYEESAESVFHKIAVEVQEEYGAVAVYIHHITGKLEIGDLIMAVVVAGPSRSEVFPALKTAVNRIKSEAALWKKEYLDTGDSYWIQN